MMMMENSVIVGAAFQDSSTLGESWCNEIELVEKSQDTGVSVLKQNCFPRHTLSEDEISAVVRFEVLASQIAYEGGVIDNARWNFGTILDLAHIDTSLVNKAGPFYEILWVVFLDIARAQTPVCFMKYQMLANFLSVYPEFSYHSESDQLKLLNTANWMHIFTTLIPAKKNKGLIMQVIPKLVEGWNAKYVTGSGQTQATADRVRIYETEGQVEKYVRGRGGKSKNKRKGLGSPGRVSPPITTIKSASSHGISSIMSPVYAIVGQSTTKSSSKKLCPSTISKEEHKDCVTWKISGTAFSTGSTDGEDNISQTDDTDDDLWIENIRSHNFAVNDELLFDFMDLCDVAPAYMRIISDRQALVQLLDDVGGSENPATLISDIPPDVFSMPSPTNRKRCREVAPPMLARQVSWGGTRAVCSSPLRTFPSQHCSLSVPNDPWLAGDA